MANLENLWKAIQIQNEKMNIMTKDIERLDKQNSFLLQSLKSGVLLPVINQEDLAASKMLAIQRESTHLQSAADTTVSSNNSLSLDTPTSLLSNNNFQLLSEVVVEDNNEEEGEEDGDDDEEEEDEQELLYETVIPASTIIDDEIPSGRRSYTLKEFTVQLINGEKWQDISSMQGNNNNLSSSDHELSPNNHIKKEQSPKAMGAVYNHHRTNASSPANTINSTLTMPVDEVDETNYIRTNSPDFDLPQFTSSQREDLSLERVKLMDLYNANLRFSKEFYDHFQIVSLNSQQQTKMGNNNNKIIQNGSSPPAAPPHHPPPPSSPPSNESFNSFRREQRQRTLKQFNNQMRITQINSTTKTITTTSTTNKVQQMKNYPGFFKLSALVKGHLTRKVFRTQRVQETISVLKESALLLIQSQSWNDINLKLRLKNQIRASLMQLHEIFFKWPIISRLRLIYHDEIHNRNKRLSENVSAIRTTKSISSATIKRLEEKQQRTASSLSGGTAKGKSYHNSLVQRVLKPLPQNNHPDNATSQSLSSRRSYQSNATSTSTTSFSKSSNIQPNFNTPNKFNPNIIKKRFVSRGKGNIVVQEQVH